MRGGQGAITVNAAKCGPSVLLAIFLASPCAAHHGVAPHYDNSKPVRLEGVVSKFDFINPHAFVYITTLDDAGAEQVWQCELASRTVLARNGITAVTFKVGERITLEGVAARVNTTGCAFRVAYFADGSILRSTELFAPTVASTAEVPSDVNSIVGVWTMKRFSVARYDGALTPAGERAREAFDPISDDPAIYCDPASPVRFWINVNEPFEIRREEDSVVVDHRFMDSQRIVHLSDEPPAPDLERSSMGYSTGHFDGRALVISTDGFIAATLEPRYGVMHTQDLQFGERLEVNEATGDLEINWVIDDPAYFKEPFAQKELFVRSTRDSEPYDCKPGYQQ
jgi:hypothetical protein